MEAQYTGSSHPGVLPLSILGLCMTEHLAFAVLNCLDVGVACYYSIT